ncbi:PREDICTED: uncharacterized protein LOC104827729 isoform X2 [Tarenaya hassleriana]|uniref:uncharacterized protein LOC104827729 isoform X2 n=1 Tax=Tarenaya hassleriana TaxID=28532 RepID=UPI00053C46CC|nr:PREDICTED: uncharacterized protein LOC104827729 isoform X2 [Tarenaya hassleriana]
MGGRDGGGVAGKGNNINLGVPAMARNVVQGLKEVVNCSDQEIYAMLVECDMDPDEAVSRLLSQDTFHEVKSKRDKKKETKDTTDSQSRRTGSILNRGGCRSAGGDNYAGRGGGHKFNSNEPGGLLAKPANKRENRTRNHVAGSSSTSGVAWSQHPFSSDPKGTENTSLSTGSGDAVPSSSQASSRHQRAWVAIPGQRTMADIVKMGRPLHPNIVIPHSSDPPNSSKETESRAPLKDEWPSIEKLGAAYSSSVLKVPTESKLYDDPFSDGSVRADHHMKSQLDEDPVTETHPVGAPIVDQVRPASVSSRNLNDYDDDDSGGSSLYDNDDNNNIIEPYETERHLSKHDGAEDVATTIQHLSIENDNQGAFSEEDKPAVIIPNHLQVHTSDCSHLRFGSFGSGMGSDSPGAHSSGLLNKNLEEIPETADDSSIRLLDTRDSEFYGDDERLGNVPDGNMAYHIDSSARNYDSASDSVTERLKQETPEPAHENEHNYSSATDYAFDSNQQLNPALAPPETGPQIQNLDDFPEVMQAYANSLPSTLLPSTIRDVRESDLQYSPFPLNQSMPTNFNNTAASLAGPAIPMTDALRATRISTQQTEPGAMGPAAALAMHPYSQPTLPLGHYANMIGYPFLPQSYTYMPSAFQQAFSGNNTYHQPPLSAMLPHYKSNNLPQSAAAVPGGNNIPLNPSNAVNSLSRYDNVLGSQFRDGNQLALASLQQNENPRTWFQGQNSRLESSMYRFHGQNQQRQGQQQPLQHGYLSHYHSQGAMPMGHNHNHLQLNPTDSSKQTQQPWQPGY